MAVVENTSSELILTADGTPLKVSLERSLLRRKLRAVALVLPPMLFLIILFVVPIGNLLTRSVDNTLLTEALPRTFTAFEAWDRKTLPHEPLFEAIFHALTTAEKYVLGKTSTRLNYEKPGWKSLIKKSTRKFRKKIKGPPYKAAMINIDKRWADITFWQSLGAVKKSPTLGYFLNAIDRQYDVNRNVIMLSLIHI